MSAGFVSERKVNILLVDDNRESLLALEAVLSEPGLELVKSVSGADALRQMLTRRFAVVILDVQMPGMSGYDVAAMIRERDVTRYTPIIFLTALRTAESHVYQGYAAGAVDYLFKPVEPSILKSKVAAFVELARKTQLLEAANEQLERDLRMRLRAEAALRESEAKFRSVTDMANDAIVSADKQGLITYFNKQAERIFGYSGTEIAGLPLTVLMPDRYANRRIGGLQRLLAASASRQIGDVLSLIGRRKDGREFPIELSLASWRKNEDVHFSAIIRDITGRVQLERQILSISEREQQRFARDLHDGLFQHLKGISYMAGVMKKRLVKAARPNSRMASRIENLCNEAIVTGRNITRGLSPVTLETGGLTFALGELASSTSCVFDLSCNFDCPRPVSMDDNTIDLHLFRIAQEAVNNAIKHGIARRIHISLAEESGQVVLTVQDDGTGLPEVLTDMGGMGIHIMNYRARMIEAMLEIRRGDAGGTIVTCVLQREPNPVACDPQVGVPA